MPTPSKGPRMGGSPAHERHMLANLANQLFTHGRITTTEAKAKRLRPYAEHLITFAKRGDLHARRQVIKRLGTRAQMENSSDTVMHVLFDQIGPRYATRPGGYTRIVKLGPRKGDNAPMAIIELVEAMTVAQQAVGEAERARGTTFAASNAPTGATREAAQELAAESPTAAAVLADAEASDAEVSDVSAADSFVEVAPAGDEVLPVEVVPEGDVALDDAAEYAATKGLARKDGGGRVRIAEGYDCHDMASLASAQPGSPEPSIR